MRKCIGSHFSSIYMYLIPPESTSNRMTCFKNRFGNFEVPKKRGNEMGLVQKKVINPILRVINRN